MDNLRAAYKMNELQEDNKGLTRSPQINELISLVSNIRLGKANPEDLKDALEELKEMIQGIRVMSDALKTTQPASDNFEEKYARMIELFEMLIEELNNMALYIDDQNDEYLETPLENIKQYINEVLDIADDFKKVEDYQPMYSYSLYINEMLRVGYGYLQGQFRLIDFTPRYQVAKEAFEESYAQMQAMINAPKDTKALEENFPKILELLESMKASFEEIETLLESENPEENKEALMPLLEKIKQGSYELYVIQVKINEEIEKLEEEKTKRICPKCGEKTSVYEKYCQSCKVLLPPLPEGYIESISKISIVHGEGIPDSTAPVEPTIPDGHILISPNILKIYEAAFKVGQGEISKEEFTEVINWYDGILSKTRKDMASIKEPEGLDENGKMLFNETFKLLIEGTEESQQGLDEIKKYLEDSDVMHLVNGVNAIMKAGEKLNGVQAMGEVAARRVEELKQQEAAQEQS